MNIWWVNHKQTARYEISGRYLWSPKKERNGSRSQYYDFMRETRPGDIVVSFVNAEIGHHGVVTGLPVSSPKPEDFGNTGTNWSNDGWLVPVSWARVKKPFRPKDNIDALRSFLPKTYAPIQANGNGNQKAYLTKISQDLFSELKTLGNFEPEEPSVEYWLSENSPLIASIEDTIQATIETDQSLSETETEALVKARKGQGIFRRNVAKIETKCRVTTLEDARLLIASHIKPWRACETAQERLDGANGLLLAPHIDRLFDIGLISFEKNGDMLVSKTLSQQVINCLGLSRAISGGVGAFSESQETYLSFHRESIFIA